MARYTGPVCRMCRREGMKLFLKGLRCDTPKCAVERRDSAPGKIGRQMQTWVRFPEGWRIVAAHISIIDEPKP